MESKKFYKQQKANQEKWWKTNISSKVKGRQNDGCYDHIIPRTLWTLNLWEGIRNELLWYLCTEGIKAHTGTHNLLSSWILCTNIYFPIKCNERLKSLIAEFLKLQVSNLITDVSDIALEFAFEEGSDLHPAKLLGEKDGSRGIGQTSPDIAFFVKTKTGEGIILCESKFTEHSFYACSARKLDNNSKCMVAANKCTYKDICHQSVLGRKYLDMISFSDNSKETLKRCPAATVGFQLLRQQALAEGIAQSGKYELVVSAVAFDACNTSLIHCLKSTGINDFQSEWSPLFDSKAVFKTWTHRAWVKFVRNKNQREFDEWLSYLQNRYRY
jgi:hypothetical protein